MDNFRWIVNYDGDDAGRMIGRAILSNQLGALHEASDRIKLGNEIVEKWSNDHGGVTISNGGDQGAFEVPHEALESLDQLMRDYHFATQLTMSMGVGKTLSESGKALLAAKFRGKNQIVYYDFSVENDLEKVKNNLTHGTASEEEKKQGEAYLQPTEQEIPMDEKDKYKNAYAQTDPEPLWNSEEPDDAGGPQPMHDSEQLPTDGTLTQEHDCPYCNELQAQNITDEDCPYCADTGHDPNAPDHLDDCQYCAVMSHDPDMEGHTDDCAYCQEMAMHDPMMDGHADDCPYCARSHDPNMEGHPEDCQYCARADQWNGGNGQEIEPSSPSSQVLPTTQDSQDYDGQDLPRPDLDKPSAISAVPSGLGFNTDSQTNENIKLEDTQGKQDPNMDAQMAQASNPEGQETVNDIIGEIDAVPTDEVPGRPKINQTDDANMAIGTNMEGNVSREDSYSQDVPTDLGLGEEPDNDSPDISSVLKEGLDNHADSIKREKVMEMVGEALEGFKASKMIIERAKTEAPQFYQSSIAMLKAMIEMCKMLGLDQQQAMTPSGVLNPQASADEPIVDSKDQVEDPEASYEAHMSQPGNTPMGGPESAEQDGHPNYSNLFPPHPDGKAGNSDPKLQGL